jgi:hypothetical protein
LQSGQSLPGGLDVLGHFEIKHPDGDEVDAVLERSELAMKLRRSIFVCILAILFIK